MTSGRPVQRHVVRLLAALAMAGLLLGPSARATTAVPPGRVRPVGPAVTSVPGHDSSEWLRMGPHCSDVLS